MKQTQQGAKDLTMCKTEMFQLTRPSTFESSLGPSRVCFF